MNSESSSSGSNIPECSHVSVPKMMSVFVPDRDVLNVWILFFRLWKFMTKFVTRLFLFLFRPWGGAFSGVFWGEDVFFLGG